MKRRRSPFPAYVQAFRDRHGAPRTYFRRAGIRIALPVPALDEVWWEAYRATARRYDGWS